jgi:hypothetical protein
MLIKQPGLAPDAALSLGIDLLSRVLKRTRELAERQKKEKRADGEALAKAKKG